MLSDLRQIAKDKSIRSFKKSDKNFKNYKEQIGKNSRNFKEKKLEAVKKTINKKVNLNEGNSMSIARGAPQYPKYRSQSERQI